MKALITGASSGIGEAYANKLAQQGYDLILTGRREKHLYKVSSAIRKKYPVNIEILLLELANETDLEILTDKINCTPDLHVLINNAGFGSGTRFLEKGYSDAEKMVKVHIMAPLKLIHAALPKMKERGNGIIINVSSVSGNTPLLRGAVYSASKSFLRIFSEALYLENIHSNIIIQTLCPGFTRTDFHKKIGLNNDSLKNKGILRWMTPEEVVDISFRNLRKGKVVCVPGFWNKVLWLLADILPKQLYYSLIVLAEKQEHKVVPSGEQKVLSKLNSSLHTT